MKGRHDDLVAIHCRRYKIAVALIRFLRPQSSLIPGCLSIDGADSPSSAPEKNCGSLYCGVGETA